MNIILIVIAVIMFLSTDLGKLLGLYLLTGILSLVVLSIATGWLFVIGAIGLMYGLVR